MKVKVISFIIGCILGGLIGGYQVKSWGAELPLGSETDMEMSVEEGLNYLNENRITVPQEVENACVVYGSEYNINFTLLEAVAWEESRFNADVSNGSCKGLMQINTYSHKKRMNRIGASDAYNIDDAVHIAADYLAELRAENNDVKWVLNTYNGKSKNNSYANRVLKTANALEILTWD